MNKIAAVLTLLLLSGAGPVYAVDSCEAVFGTSRSESVEGRGVRTESPPKILTEGHLFPAAEQRDFLKHYGFLNLNFPQHPETVRAGITAFYLAREIPFHQMYTRVSERDWETIHGVMTRVHEVNRVDRVISLPEMRNSLMHFILAMPYLLRSAAEYIASPTVLPERQIVAENLAVIHAPQHAERFLRARHYSQSVLDALRTPRVRALAHHFRESIAGGTTIPYEQRIFKDQIGGRVQELVVEHLIAAHPELAARTPSGETQALVFYRALSTPSLR